MLGYFLVRDVSFFAPDMVTWEAMFFAGAAISITAFPMLARIIYERGLSGTSLGTLALATGSIDDGAAWCVLALVLASFSSDPMIAVLAIGTLMNARGLMELIILNIGLERGMINPLLFAVMVITAIVTTLMASPIFEWVYQRPAVTVGVSNTAEAAV